MTKVIRLRQYGGPAVLRVETEAIGAAGAGQVRLAQTAIGVNYVDVLLREGLYPTPLPAIPGFEAAGVVEAVGPGVSGFEPGDKVAYFFADGAYASENVVPAQSLVRLPDDISAEVAATFLAKGLTAWMGLRALYPVKARDRILVLGASGSVGSILSRWAKQLGATVIGVAGSIEKLDKVAAGSSHALFAGDPEINAKVRAIAPAGVEVVYDFVGQATFEIGVAAVRDGGVIAAIGAASGQPTPASDALNRRGVQVRGGGTPQYVRGATVPVATEELWAAVRSGLFADLDVARYRFEDVVRLHEDLDRRRLAGLPILIP